MKKIVYLIIFIISLFLIGCVSPIKYTIIFDTAGAGEIENIVVEEGMKITEPNTPIKEGYTFEGWYVGEEKWVFAGYEVTSDMTLKAKWTAKEYTISFDTDGGEQLNPIKVKYGDQIVLETPVKENHIFIGWDKELPNTMPSNDLLLKALWANVNDIEINYESEMSIGSEDIIEINVLNGVKLNNIRFETTDEGIIEINENKIKAISSGNCTVLVYVGETIINELNIKVKKEILTKEDILNSSEVIEIKFRVPSGSISMMIKEFIYDFEKEYNGKVKVILDTITGGYDGLLAQNLYDLSKNKAPNITVGYIDHLIAYNELNGLMELDKYIEKDNIDLNDFVEGFVNKIDEEKTYNLPLYRTSDVLVYNKSVFDKMKYNVPTTWAELEVLSKDIYNDAKNGLLDGYSMDAKPSKYVSENKFYSFSYDILINFFENISKQFEFPFVEKVNDNEAKAIFNNEKAIEILEYFQGLANNKMFGLPMNFDVSYSSNAFKDMQCIMVTSSSTGVGYNIPSSSDFEVGVAQLPVNEDNKTIKTSGIDLCVLNQSTDLQKAVCWELIKYLTNTENSAKLAKEFSGYFPVRKSSYETSIYKDVMNQSGIYGEVAEIGLEYADSYKYFSYDGLKGLGDVREAAEYALERIFVNNENVKQTLDEAVENVGKDPTTPKMTIEDLFTSNEINIDVELTGTVYYVCPQGFWLTDETGYTVYVYNKTATLDDVDQGDKVKVTGKKILYYSMYDIENPTIEVLEKSSGVYDLSSMIKDNTIDAISTYDKDYKHEYGRIYTISGKVVEDPNNRYTYALLDEASGKVVVFYDTAMNDLDKIHKNLEENLDKYVTIDVLVWDYYSSGFVRVLPVSVIK